MNQASPIRRFLGDVKMEHGPFGLLSLPPRMHDGPTINRALGMQLARLSRHPQGMSTEADEVRLALHVAAAQLRDPEVQREVLVECSYPMRDRPESAAPKERTRKGAAPTTRAPTQRSAPASVSLQAQTSSIAMFERAALWVLVHSGGWNKEAQRRLASLAHTFGVDQSDFQRALSNVGRRSRSGRQARHPVAERASNGAVHRPSPTEDLAESHVEEEDFPVSSVVRLSILIVLTVLTGVMGWRLVTIRARHLAQNPSSSMVNSESGQPVDQLVERTITMPELPSPSQEVPLASPDVSPVEAGGTSTPLPLPSSPDAQLPPDVNVDRVIADWERRARVATERAERCREPYEHLEHAVRLAQVNLAAAQHWSGSASAARSTLRNADSYRPPRLSVTATEQRQLVDLVASLTAPGEVTDGDLAMLFLLARRQPQKHLPELRQIRIGSDPLGPLDADVVAEAVLFAAPKELRQLASGFVIQQADNPVMVYALLEALADAPRHESGSTIIEQVTGRSLPGSREEHWYLEARRALLGRLFELLGGEADPGIDTLARQLATYLRASAVELGAPDAPSASIIDSPDRSLGPDEAAGMMMRRWRELGETYMGAAWFAERTGELQQRRVLRLALARGPMQRFAAEHASAVEQMAELIRAERPSQSRAIDSILDRFAGARQNATHVFEQVSAGEMASASLWSIRFGLKSL